MGAKRSAVTAPAAMFADAALVRGTLIGTDGGYPIVRYAGGPKEGVRCEVLQQIDAPLQASSANDTRVLLALPSDGGTPVLVGVIGRAPDIEAPFPARNPLHDKRHVLFDGEALVLEAQREIVLRCGQSEITLTRDGKVLIKGKDVVTRAARTNRIKGANVQIN